MIFLHVVSYVKKIKRKSEKVKVKNLHKRTLTKLDATEELVICCFLKKVKNYLLTFRKMKFMWFIAISTKTPKILFFPGETPISGEEWPENLRTSIVMQIEWWSISKENISPTPWYQNPCYASTFLHAKPNFREKNFNFKNSISKIQFQAKIYLSLLSSPPKI